VSDTTQGGGELADGGAPWRSASMGLRGGDDASVLLSAHMMTLDLI
jgi:hypothetical protein